MNNAGVTFIDGIATAGHSVANRRPLDGASAADDIVLTAAPAHGVPLGARAVIIQIPVVWKRDAVQ